MGILDLPNGIPAKDVFRRVLMMLKPEAFEAAFTAWIARLRDEALADIRSVCSIPIATGERQFTRWGFKELLKSGAADIIQPDCSHTGGISELKKIATMAETYQRATQDPVLMGEMKQFARDFYNKFREQQMKTNKLEP